jgi:hypothetical protein
MRPSFHCHHRVPAIRRQDAARPPPARQLGAQDRDCSHPRVDTEMLHAGAMGQGAGEDAVALVEREGSES